MNAQETLRQTNILYYALLAGQTLFCLILIFVISDPETRQSGWPEAPFGLLIPIMFVSLITAAYVINQKRLATGAAESDLTAKAAHYRSVVIIRSSLIEGLNLFCLVAMLLENNLTYLIFFAAGLLVFLYFRPSVDEFMQHYQLSSAEKSDLQ